MLLLLLNFRNIYKWINLYINRMTTKKKDVIVYKVDEDEEDEEDEEQSETKLIPRQEVEEELPKLQESILDSKKFD